MKKIDIFKKKIKGKKLTKPRTRVTPSKVAPKITPKTTPSKVAPKVTSKRTSRITPKRTSRITPGITLDEEKLRKAFFRKVLETREKEGLNAEKFLEMLDRFVIMHGNNPKREKYAENLTHLSGKNIGEYINTLLNTDVKSDDLLREFLKREDIIGDIQKAGLEVPDLNLGEDLEENLGQEEDDDSDYDNIFTDDEDEGELDYPEHPEEITPPKKLQKIDKTFFKDPGEIPNLPKIKTGRKAIVIQPPDVERILPPKDVEMMEAEEIKLHPTDACVNLYRNTEWLDQRAKNIWLSPVDLGSLDTNIDKYIIDSSIMSRFGTEWYKATKTFLQDRCNIYGNLATQKDYVLTFYDNNKNPINVRVMFELPHDNYVLQDEKIFNKERQFIMNKSLPYIKKIKLFLKRSVKNLSDGEIEAIKSMMYNYIQKNIAIIKNSSEEELSRDIVDIIIERSMNGDINTLVRNFALFLVYFDTNIINIAKTFKERIINNYYTPLMLANITVEDVIPEIFLDPRISNKQKNIMYTGLNNIFHILSDNIELDIYYLLNPEDRRFTPPFKIPILEIDIQDNKNLRNICGNLDDIPENVSPKDLYIYKDKEKFYCFDLNNLNNTILSGINPYTNEKFPEKVKNDIVSMYNSKNIKIIPESTITIDKPIVQDKPVDVDMLIPGFLNMVLDDIKDLETQIGIKNENYVFKFPIEKSKEESKEEESEGEKEGEKSEEEIIPQDYNCFHCKNLVEKLDSSMSTIIKDKDCVKTVFFCNVKCFDDHEKWPRIK